MIILCLLLKRLGFKIGISVIRKNGTLEIEKNELTDFNAKIQKLKKYNGLLRQVSNKGLAGVLYNEILNMSMDDGIKFMEIIMKTSDLDLQEYSQEYTMFQALTDASATMAYKGQAESLVKKIR